MHDLPPSHTNCRLPRSSAATTLLVVALVLAALPGLLAAERGLPPHLLLGGVPKDAAWVPVSVWAVSRQAPRGERLSTPSKFGDFVRAGAFRGVADGAAPVGPSWDACPVAGGVDERLLNLPPPMPG